MLEDGFFLVRMILGHKGVAAHRSKLLAEGAAPRNDPTIYSFKASPQQLQITHVRAEDVLPKQAGATFDRDVEA